MRLYAQLGGKGRSSGGGGTGSACGSGGSYACNSAESNDASKTPQQVGGRFGCGCGAF